jgi:hypothetical protein
VSATVISRCDPAPIFEPSEGVFNFVPFFVERLVVVVLDFAALFRRDAWIDPFFDQGIAEPVAVITPIPCQRFGLRQRGKQNPCSFMVAHLAFGEQQDQRLTVTTGHRVQLRVQAALGAPDAAGNSPFFRRLAAVR